MRRIITHDIPDADSAANIPHLDSLACACRPDYTIGYTDIGNLRETFTHKSFLEITFDHTAALFPTSTKG